MTADNMFWRIWRVEVTLLAVAITMLIAVGGRTFAQIQRFEQSQAERDERRLQRQLDGLQRAHDDLRLDIEKRLTRIETYTSAITWLLGTIIGVLLIQLAKGLLDLLAVRRMKYPPATKD